MNMLWWIFCGAAGLWIGMPNPVASFPAAALLYPASLFLLGTGSTGWKHAFRLGWLCGLAGALYVPQVGIINPSEMSPTNSIEAAIWVALGGRGTLIGPVLGAGLVNGAKSIFTVAMPEYWQLFLGLIFIIVTLFLPRGVMGLLRRGDR